MFTRPGTSALVPACGEIEVSRTMTTNSSSQWITSGSQRSAGPIPARRYRLAKGILSCLVSLLLAVAAWPANAQENPAISIVPTSGACNERVTVSGSGFLPQSQVKVSVGRAGSDVTKNSTDALADNSGRFHVDLSAYPSGCPASFATVPVAPPANQLVFSAVGQSVAGQQTRAQAIFTVTAGPETLPSTGLKSQEHSPSVLWLAASLVAAGVVLLAAPWLIHKRARPKSLS